MLITALLISLAASSDPITFSEHLIFDQFSYPYGIAAGDFDGDGDLDISSADCKTNDSLYWFENDGAGRFTQHFVQKNDPERLERHALGDINGDGHLDIVIVKNLRGHLLWFENSGTPRDGKLWKRHVITTELPGAYDVTLADIDRDGDLDVAASSWILGNQFAWFENDGSPDDGTWTNFIRYGATTSSIPAANSLNSMPTVFRVSSSPTLCASSSFAFRIFPFCIAMYLLGFLVARTSRILLSKLWIFLL